MAEFLLKFDFKFVGCLIFLKRSLLFFPIFVLSNVRSVVEVSENKGNALKRTRTSKHILIYKHVSSVCFKFCFMYCLYVVLLSYIFCVM